MITKKDLFLSLIHLNNFIFVQNKSRNIKAFRISLNIIKQNTNLCRSIFNTHKISKTNDYTTSICKCNKTQKESFLFNRLTKKNLNKSSLKCIQLFSVKKQTGVIFTVFVHVK